MKRLHPGVQRIPFTELYARKGLTLNWYPRSTYRHIKIDPWDYPAVYSPIYCYQYDASEFTVFYALKSYLDYENYEYKLFLITDQGVFAEEGIRNNMRSLIDFRETYFRKIKDFHGQLIVMEDLQMNPGRLLFIYPLRIEEWYGDQQVEIGTKKDIKTGKVIEDPDPYADADKFYIQNRCCCGCYSDMKEVTIIDNPTQPPYEVNHPDIIHPYHYFRFYEKNRHGKTFMNDLIWTEDLAKAIYEKKIYIDIPANCYVDPRDIHFWAMGWWI